MLHSRPLRSPSSASFARTPGPRAAIQLVRRPQRSPSMACDASDSPEAVVGRQLEAYNARDLEAFMAILDDDCVATNAVTGEMLGRGKEQLRKRYEARFQTEVHSELLARVSLGPVVVDREIITGLPNGEAADCLATYQVADGKIQSMTFVWQPRTTS